MSDADAEHLMPTEMKLIEKSRVLLFVFTSDTYGAAEMIMVSFFDSTFLKFFIALNNSIFHPLMFVTESPNSENSL